jgi:hypothetical protein
MVMRILVSLAAHSSNDLFPVRPEFTRLHPIISLLAKLISEELAGATVY